MNTPPPDYFEPSFRNPKLSVRRLIIDGRSVNGIITSLGIRRRIAEFANSALGKIPHTTESKNIHFACLTPTDLGFIKKPSEKELFDNNAFLMKWSEENIYGNFHLDLCPPELALYLLIGDDIKRETGTVFDTTWYIAMRAIENFHFFVRNDPKLDIVELGVCPQSPSGAIGLNTKLIFCLIPNT